MPGVIDEIIAKAPLYTRIVVVGVCMGADQIRPAMAINKEIDLRFVIGYSPVRVPRVAPQAGRGRRGRERLS